MANWVMTTSVLHATQSSSSSSKVIGTPGAPASGSNSRQTFVSIRYVMISSMGAENPPDGDDVFTVYLRAKAEADQALMASDRAGTVVRPVSLQDDPGTGRVRIAEQPLDGEVPRDDVAAVLAAVLQEPRSVGHVLYVSAGDDPIDEALGM